MKGIKAQDFLRTGIVSKVMAPKTRRDFIVNLHLQAKRPPEIASLLNEPYSSIYCIVNRYKKEGSTELRHSPGRPRTVNTPENRRIIQNQLRRKGEFSTRKVARTTGLSRTTVQRVLKNDLGLTAYKFREAQLLTEEMKATRLKRSKALLRMFGAGRHRQIVFSDEKLFTVERSHNHQNDRIWASKPPGENGIIGRTKKPKSVMVLAGITANGKTPLVFLDSGTRINKDIYQRSILSEVLLPWSQQHFQGTHWTFQQDSAPCHTAGQVQQWMRTHFPDFIPPTLWPPYSPDLNPLDYSIWSILEQKACCKQHTSLQSLKRALTKAWNEISLASIRSIVDNFPKRLRQCIEADGSHFEF